MTPRKFCKSLTIAVIFFFLSGKVLAASWKEKVLYSFQGIPDGAVPAGGVVFDQSGNLYGATSNGGSDSCPSAGQCGTVYQLKPPVTPGQSWTETELYVFRGHGHKDGATPEGGVLIDSAGNLYGTTGYGGSGPCVLLGTAMGCGTVYQLKPPKTKGGSWTEKVLYSFQGNKDGYFPIGDLTLDSAGNLYGATQFGGGGGQSTCDQFYPFCGTIFELSPPTTKGGNWTEKVLYSFQNKTDGAVPNGGLALDKNGALYGTTLCGGDAECQNLSGGDGVVYRLKPPAKQNGRWGFKLLHTFTGVTDGGRAGGALIFDDKGALYGEAGTGGSGRCGLAFRLIPQSGDHWVQHVLYAFAGTSDGCGPVGGLVFDSVGNLYGTALGGTHFRGTVYRLTPPAGKANKPWGIAILHSFTGAPDSNHPTAGLTFDSKGRLYGTSEWGGSGRACDAGCGTVFQTKP